MLNGECDNSHTPDELMFVLTFASSVLTGAFGISKFLKCGPCKLLNNDSGFLNGFVNIGFPAVIWSNLVSLLGKGILLPIIAAPNPLRSDAVFHYSKISIWMALNLAPQFVYVSMY